MKSSHLRTVVPWVIVRRLLEVAFLVSAALNMLGRRAGFLTTHLADVAVPALLYVYSRGLGVDPPRRQPLRWIGGTPARAALVLFVASAATEASQRYWPRGVFRGRFDPMDLVAFAAGLIVVYVLDVAGGLRGSRATTPGRSRS